MLKLSSEPLIFFYTIIFTINYTVLPQLLLKKLCLKKATWNTTVECDMLDNLPDDLHKEATRWWFYLLLCSLLPTVFTVLIWGPVTDIIGRKRAMVIVPLVNGTRSLIYLTNSYFITASPAFLIFGSFLSCFYGEFQGVVALCYAYMADVTQTDLDQRTTRMAFVEASLFLSGVPAGLLSGYMLQYMGFVSVFTLTCGINLVMLLYIVFCLPESNIHAHAPNEGDDVTKSYQSDVKKGQVHRHNEVDEISSYQRQITQSDLKLPYNETPQTDALVPMETCWTKLNPFTYLTRAVTLVTRKEKRAILLPLLVAFGFTVYAVLGELIVQTLYLTHEPFKFTSRIIGYYSAMQSLIRGLGVIFFTQLSYRFLHLRDEVIVLLGLLSASVCYLLIGVVRSTVLVFVVNITGFAIPAATTTLRSLVTKQVRQCEYGAVLASLEALDALGGVASNCISLWLYDETLSVYTGVVYIILSGFSTVALFITAVIFYRNRHAT